MIMNETDGEDLRLRTGFKKKKPPRDQEKLWKKHETRSKIKIHQQFSRNVYLAYNYYRKIYILREKNHTEFLGIEYVDAINRNLSL